MGLDLHTRRPSAPNRLLPREECEEDQADGPRVASRQGMVLGSGTGIPGAGQGERGQGMVSRSGGDEGMEGQHGK